MIDLAKRYFASVENKITVGMVGIFSIPVLIFGNSPVKYIFLIGIAGVIYSMFYIIKYFILKSEIKSQKTNAANFQIIKHKKIMQGLGARWAFRNRLHGYLITAQTNGKKIKITYLFAFADSQQEEKAAEKILRKQTVFIEYYPKTKIAVDIK